MLNLLRWGMKDWGELVTHSFSHEKRAVVTCEQFLEMFCAEYVPLM